MPVGVRNVVVADEWSLSTFQAGPNFYIGNSEDADGRYHPLVRGHETPAFERRDATELAERLRKRIDMNPIPTSAESVSVTLSLGVVTVDASEAIDVNQILAMADEALYQAKNCGRNTVVLRNGITVAPCTAM